MRPEQFRMQLSDMLDDRREGLTRVRRVRSEFPDDHALQPMANAMAIAMAYAHLEGFTKDALRLYVEFIEAQALKRREVQACILAYSWRPSFQKLMGKGSLQQRVAFADERLAELEAHLEFADGEKSVDTKSNLKWSVLEELAAWLALDKTMLEPHKSRLNALVGKRNGIAHGSRAERVSAVECDESEECALAVMIALEAALSDAVESGRYRR